MAQNGSETGSASPHPETAHPIIPTVEYARTAPLSELTTQVQTIVESNTRVPKDVVMTLYGRSVFESLRLALLLPDPLFGEPLTDQETVQLNDMVAHFPWPRATQDGEKMSECEFTKPDDLQTAAINLTKRLQPDERTDVMTYVLTLIEQKAVPLSHYLFRLAGMDRAFMRPLMDFVAKHADAYSFSSTGFTGERTDDEESEYLPAILPEMLQKATYASPNLTAEYLALNPEKQAALLPILVDSIGYVPTLHAVRSIMQSTTDPSTVQSLKQLGLRLMGFAPDDTTHPFHPTLNTFYHAVENFQKYEPYEAVQQKETKLFALLAQEQIKRSGNDPHRRGITIAEIGSGGGRSTNAISVKNIPEVNIIVGIEPSEKLRQEAEQSYRSLDQEKTPVLYLSGDWNKYSFVPNAEGLHRVLSDLKLSSDSVDLLLMTGRTLAHAETPGRLRMVLSELQKLITKNGMIVADFPNPDMGAYARNRRNFVTHVLKNIGIPTDQLGEDTMIAENTIVVDSPDGTNYTNRLIIQFPMLSDICERLGLRVQELRKEPIAGTLWEGSENVYFVLTRKNAPPLDEAVINDINEQLAA